MREGERKSHENILSSSMNEWNSGIEWEKKNQKLNVYVIIKVRILESDCMSEIR